MNPLTQEGYQAFTARMREATAYIAAYVTGRMQPLARKTSKQRKPDKPKREE